MRVDFWFDCTCICIVLYKYNESYMTWDINNFATLSRYHEDCTITFEDDSKGKIVGVGDIKIGSSPLIENVVLVEGLKHNLLSNSQICDKDFKVVFYDFTCDILDKKKTLVFFSFFVKTIFT